MPISHSHAASLVQVTSIEINTFQMMLISCLGPVNVPAAHAKCQSFNGSFPRAPSNWTSIPSCFPLLNAVLKAMVLNLWHATPLGVEQPFTRAHVR